MGRNRAHAGDRAEPLGGVPEGLHRGPDLRLKRGDARLQAFDELQVRRTCSRDVSRYKDRKSPMSTATAV
jgi:hypothetical protein